MLFFLSPRGIRTKFIILIRANSTRAIKAYNRSGLYQEYIKIFRVFGEPTGFSLDFNSSSDVGW